MNSNPTLDQVRENHHLLDSSDFIVPSDVRLISHEQFTSVPEINVEYIVPNFWVKLLKKVSPPPLFCLFYAIQILLTADKKSVIIINGGTFLWLAIAYIKKFFFGKRRTLFLWFVYVEYKLGKEKRLKFFPFIVFKTKWKEAIARGALMEYDLIPVWSKKQVDSHSEHFRIPKEKFIFVPYKSNHSQNSSFDIQIDNYIFSGGNSKRDYTTLIEAVRGTNIPVIISVTNPAVKKQIEHLPNVIVLGAQEPAFAQLQAGSRFVVLPTSHSGLRGTAEANFCNAMWHKKPVIACCSMGAEDYIINGETGYVLPAGDREGLKEKILELWNNPEKTREMGLKARDYAEKNFTHKIFITRILRLTSLLGTVNK